MFFNIDEKVSYSFHMFFKKVRASAQKLEIDDPKLPKKGNVSGHHKEGEAPVEFISTVQEHHPQIFFQAIDMFVKCTCDIFE